MRNVFAIHKEPNAATVLGRILQRFAIDIPSSIERFRPVCTPLLDSIITFSKVLCTVLKKDENG